MIRNLKEDQGLKDLYEAFSVIDSYELFYNFMLDIATPQEIKGFVERLQIAKILNEKKLSYREINKQTKISLVTITRVARFLNNESYGGYRFILQKIEKLKKDDK
jgi:TrpR-related protein YerC/YecD